MEGPNGTSHTPDAIANILHANLLHANLERQVKSAIENRRQHRDRRRFVACSSV